MSYYNIQVSTNLHPPIKYNQGWRQGKSLEGAKVPWGQESLYTESSDNLPKSSILCPNWTHLYTVSLWEIHANFHIIAWPFKNEAVKPIKRIYIWNANTINIPNMDMSVSVYRVGKNI